MLMNTSLYTLLLCLSLTAAAQAQFPMPGGMQGDRNGGQSRNQLPGTANEPAPRGNGKIAGILFDSTTSKPVEFATIALLSVQTQKPVDGTTSDDRGQFSLTRIAPGEYTLRVSFLGYQDKDITGIKIERGTEINVGVVKLSPDVRTLAEVEVTGQRALIEEKVDRLVFNAEKDLTSRGGDATEVMRKVPMLSVDLDGNVSLRGSQNVRVLINNKPSTIVAASVADALKQIPADMIKTVEVITSPSARYDAEGSAGIINIVTKKNTLQGLTLNVMSGVGNRGANLGLNGNYRKGKMGFSLGGFGRGFYNPAAGQLNQITRLDSITRRTSQSSTSKEQGLFGHYQFGWDYDIDKNNAITASVRFGARNRLSQQALTTSLFENELLNRTSYRDVDSKDLSNTVDVNVDYTRQLGKPQQELSILTQFSRNNRTNNFIADLLDSRRIVTGREQNDNDSYNQESTIQIDYQSPIGRNQQIEMGGKGIFRQVFSNILYSGTTGNIPPPNRLDYDQNVAGTYLSYTYTTKNKYTFKVGGRYEYTMINAQFGQENVSGDAIPDYGNFVPSINLSKNLKAGKIIKLAYNRRLQRPGIQFLNPNINFANPINRSYGNPYLRPELTDNFELGLSVPVKSVYLNMTAFARLTNNSIESVRFTDGDGIITTTFQNIGRQEAYGVNLFGNVTLFSKWQIGGGFDAFYAYLTNNGSGTVDNIARQSNSGVVVMGRLHSSLQLGNGWGIQGFGGMRGNQVQLQGTQGTFYMYNLGVKKDFKNKRGSIGLAGENFLTRTMNVRTILETPTFTQNNLMQMYNRGVRLTFDYRFGKMSFDQPVRRRKKSVSNDDVKDGDGGGDNQQQSAPQQGGRSRQ